jgi:parallel beta-helix repeat protein/predicted outer membrane repeat protein
MINTNFLKERKMFIRGFIVSVLPIVLSASICGADIITVGPNGKYHYQTIQEAVDASVDGDEIVVAPGVYTSNIYYQPVVNINNKNISLYSSDGPEATIIEGGPNRRGMKIFYGDSYIEGFTIQNCSAIYSSGGGMSIYYANPTIVDCVFDNNDAGGDGYRGSYTYGGGAISNEGGSPTIIDCVFSGNQASGNGGAIYNKYSSSNPTIQGCLFESNTAEKGGAVYNSNSSSCNVTACAFRQNNATFYGGAIYLLEYCDVIVNESTFENNYSDLGGGGIYNQGGSLWVTGCSFHQNVALPGNGGGLDILGGGYANVESSEFTNNSAVSGGGIFVSASSALEMGTSMFCENEGGDLAGNWSDLGGNEFNSSCSTTDGACCTNDICVAIDSETCVFVGGEFVGLDTFCVDEPCPSTCLGDVTGDGQVNANDILLIISVWGACP